MSLIKRLEKGSPLTWQEGDNNLDYLEYVGTGEKALEDAHEIALTYPDYLFSSGTVSRGIFEEEILIPDFFDTLFNNPNDVNLWNQGAVTIPVDVLIKGDKISNNTLLSLVGQSFPIIVGDFPILGNTDIINSIENEEVNIVLNSSFFNFSYTWEDLGSGEYIHEFYIRLGSSLFTIATIEGDVNSLSNVDVRVL